MCSSWHGDKSKRYCHGLVLNYSVRRTSAVFGISLLERFRLLLSNQETARVVTNTPKIACLAFLGRKLRARSFLGDGMLP